MLSSWLFSNVLTSAFHSFALIFVITVAPAALLILYVTRWPKSRPVEARRAIAFRPDAVPNEIDTIVIGSGSGGSTCANLLAQSGQRVLILEQHDKTGGCTHSFRDNNCEFDSGLHYTSKAMSQVTTRPGAIMDFMSRGCQKFTPLDDPYDEILFPAHEDVVIHSSEFRGKYEMPSYHFNSGKYSSVESIVTSN
jgi:hypothetical protein